MPFKESLMTLFYTTLNHTDGSVCCVGLSGLAALLSQPQLLMQEEVRACNSSGVGAWVHECMHVHTHMSAFVDNINVGMLHLMLHHKTLLATILVVLYNII